MSIHRWFARRLERIAESIQTASEEAFDAAVAKIDALAATVSRWMSRAPDRDETPMSMELHGSADAAGEHTEVDVDIDGALTDHGAVSVGVGRCVTRAAAEAGPRNPQSVVDADAGSSVEGADFVLTLDHTEVGPNHTTATHALIAIDLAFYDAPCMIEIGAELDELDHEVIDVAEGNRARVAFDADIRGDDGLVDVVAQAVVVEDRFSGSTLDAMLAIG